MKSYKFMLPLVVVFISLTSIVQAEETASWDSVKEKAAEAASESEKWVKEQTKEADSWIQKKSQEAQEWMENEGKEWAERKGKEAVEVMEKSAEAAKEWGKDVLDKAEQELEKRKKDKEMQEAPELTPGISA